LAALYEKESDTDDHGRMGTWCHPASDAIYQVNVPFVKSLYANYPHCELTTCGAVGLPDVRWEIRSGHMNIGAGRGLPGIAAD
jgi:bisphosphoglycerate-independent phosphoglycerate mutase (AlkP superfamily)